MTNIYNVYQYWSTDLAYINIDLLLQNMIVSDGILLHRNKYDFIPKAHIKYFDKKSSRYEI